MSPGTLRAVLRSFHGEPKTKPSAISADDLLKLVPLKDRDASWDCCPFCLTVRQFSTSETCTYGMRHEWPVKTVIKPQVMKVKEKCPTCGLHPKNPACKCGVT